MCLLLYACKWAKYKKQGQFMFNDLPNINIHLWPAEETIKVINRVKIIVHQTIMAICRCQMAGI
jgi:hypothetical protein